MLIKPFLIQDQRSAELHSICNGVQCRIMQYNAEQCSTMQNNAVQLIVSWIILTDLNCIGYQYINCTKKYINSSSILIQKERKKKHYPLDCLYLTFTWKTVLSFQKTVILEHRLWEKKYIFFRNVKYKQLKEIGMLSFKTMV